MVRTRSSAPICRSSSRANGWGRCSSRSRRPAPTSARCAPRPSAPPTAATASAGRKSSSPMASTTSPTTSFISCWRGCPTRRRERGASRSSWCRNSCSTPTARSERATTRAPIRSSTSSAFMPPPPAPWSTATHGGATGFLIGEENRGMACMFTMMNQARLVGRPAGRRHRRARDATGAGLCARAQAGSRNRSGRWREPDHRASRRQAHAAHHARAHPRRARDLLRHRRLRSTAPSAARTKPRAGPRKSVPRC